MRTTTAKLVSLLLCTIFLVSVTACSEGNTDGNTNKTYEQQKQTEAKAAAYSDIITIDEKWTAMQHNDRWEELYIEYNTGNKKVSQIYTYNGALPGEVIKIKNTIIASFDTGGSGGLCAFYAINYDEKSNSLISQCFEGCSYAVWLQDGFKGGISLNGAEYEGEFSDGIKENMCKNGTYTDSGVLLEEPKHKNIEKSLYSLIIADGSSIKTLRDVTDESSGYMKFGAVEIIYNIEDDGSITQQPARFYTLDEMTEMSWKLMSQ